MAVSWWQAAQALLPILLVLVLMAGAGWGAAKAGPLGWLAAIVMAALAFGAGPQLIWVSQGKALLLSAYVLYIIWMALALFHVADEAGALPILSAAVSRVTADPLLQLLIIAWGFASFLQGVTGFGVPAAVVAPLLTGLGFSPLTSVVAASMGHAWAVTFGSIASSFYAMIAVTGLRGEDLAPWSAALSGATCLGCGAIVAWLHGGPRGVAAAWRPLALMGTAMAGTQFALAAAGLWGLAAFSAGLVGSAAGAAYAWWAGRAGLGPARPASDAPPVGWRPVAVAGSVYAVLFCLIVGVEALPEVAAVLNRVELRVAFPETSTSAGWVNPAAEGRRINPFGHPGAMIAYSAVIGHGIYARAGMLRSGAGRRIVTRTFAASRQPTLAVLSLVGMALVMADAGMTFVLAERLSVAAGGALPIIAPFIGALGAFLTGSNTNSNVLFAPLQLQTARLAALPVPLIMAAQNVGGAVGSAFAPAKIIVACSTAGMVGREGKVLRHTLRYGAVLLAGAGVITWLVVTMDRAQ